jgi:hypothetical protein
MALSKTDDCMKSVCGGGGTPAVVDNPCGGGERDGIAGGQRDEDSDGGNNGRHGVGGCDGGRWVEPLEKCWYGKMRHFVPNLS